MTNKSTKNPQTASDLQGASKLVVDAVRGVTDIVEDMHRTIMGLSPIVGQATTGRTKGITGLVYRSVRGVTQAVGLALDAGLAQMSPLFHGRGALPHREAMQAAVNGVLGDYLVASMNPLAIPMPLRQHGKPLVLEGQTGGKLLVLVHGLCMNDLQWLRDGHDHGASLAQDLGYTPVYLHYNTGRPIALNGQEFADALEQLVKDWPVRVSELAIVGHSMGGLVTRSACGFAKEARHAWLGRLKKLVFLGTPHHGAPLERAGSWLDFLLGVSPYSAPLARLGLVRSAGIKDLRHGKVRGKDLPDQALLPARVKCFVVAATQSEVAGKRLQGDGLVPVNSALGHHKDPAMSLPIPAARQCVVYATDHFDLLSSPVVYQQLKHWLA